MLLALQLGLPMGRPQPIAECLHWVLALLQISVSQRQQVSSTRVPATYMGNPDWVLGSQLQFSPVLATAGFWSKKPVDGRYLYLLNTMKIKKQKLKNIISSFWKISKNFLFSRTLPSGSLFLSNNADSSLFWPYNLYPILLSEETVHGSSFQPIL